MISKELLSAVLGVEVKAFELDGNTIEYRFEKYSAETDKVCSYTRSRNIYELTHICKEWAYGVTAINGKEGNFIMSTLKHNIDASKALAWVAPSHERSTDTAYIYKTFETDTEPEAIFRACQWVLDNKDQ